MPGHLEHAAFYFKMEEITQKYPKAVVDKGKSNNAKRFLEEGTSFLLLLRILPQMQKWKYAA